MKFNFRFLIFILILNSDSVWSHLFGSTFSNPVISKKYEEDPYIRDDELLTVVSPKSKASPQYSENIESGRISGNTFSEGYQNHIKINSNWITNFPKVYFRLDPILNFKIKQRIRHFGTCITLGMDYLSELGRWRFHCGVEDVLVGGRFSVRGSELGWAKSWVINMGMGEDNAAKFKLRLGYNMKTGQAYARVRFRTEPITPFDIQDGLSCAGKVPLPPVLPLFRLVPLRAEYKLRIFTPVPNFELKRSEKDNKIAFSTGIDRIDVSLDELNFCLEWDEHSPLWDIGIVQSSNGRRNWRNVLSRRNINANIVRMSNLYNNRLSK